MENQPPKITYLFGAGASAQALPTIKQLPERIKHVIDFIKKNYSYEADDVIQINSLKINKIDAKQYLLEGLDKLYSYSGKHSTIDTYAKKLYLNRNESM